MMKRSILIVNADDYAMNETISSAVRAAFSEGLISSSSCFSTSPFFDEEIRKAFDAGIKTFGVHLDLSFGKPVSLGIGQEKFPEKSSKTLNKIQIKSEFEAQIQRALNSGIQVSHLDNHRDELYWETEKFEVVYELAKQFSLPVRNPLGKNIYELGRRIFNNEETIKSFEIISLKHREMREKHSTRTTEFFYSLEHYRDNPLEKIKQIAQGLELQKTSIEICTHLTHELIGGISEKQFLTNNIDFKEILKKHCGTFADV